MYTNLADFSLQNMDYIEYSNQIIAVNYEEVIVANPKTFKSEAKLEILNLVFANVIPKTQYVILTQSTNQLFVYDSQKNQILSSQDFLQYGSSLQKQSFLYSRIFQFKCQDDMVIITGSTIGIFATSISKSNLTLISHGLIQNSKSDRFQIISSNFTSSSFTDQILIQNAKESILNQYGGMVYATINSIQIQNCLFNQSTASKGSFLYIQSFGAEINIQINKTQFLEGYSFIDGSAIFIDNLGYQFNLTCNDCLFENLFAFNPYSSQIGIQNYNLDQKNFSFLTFIGGGIKNFNGVIQSYFLNMQFVNIRFENVTNIASQEFSSKSFPNIIYQREPLKVQSGLLNLVSSQAYIFNTNISNFKIQNQYLISLLGGSIIFDNTNFSNINQVSNIRILGNILNEQQNFANSYSMIVANNSQIQVLNKSTFFLINCNICNGGAFQMSNSNFDIQNSTFIQINSYFGGALFITNLFGNNQIQDVTFQSCLSQQDGGSLYIQSQAFNGYNLNITSTQFYENHSINGRGGAIFISSSLLNPKNASSNILNSQFISNKAQIGGGLFYENISLALFNNTFENNNGLIYGNDTFSYPSKLIWLNLQNFTSKYNIQISDNSIEFFNFRSGDSLKNIQFQLINDQNQVIFPISEEEFETFDVQVKINPNTTNAQNYQIRGDQYIYFNKDLNVFQFEEITIVGVLGTSKKIEQSSQLQIENSDSKSKRLMLNSGSTYILNRSKQINRNSKQKDSRQQSVYIKLFTNYIQIISSVVSLNLFIPNIFVIIILKKLLSIYIELISKKIQKLSVIVWKKLNSKKEDKISSQKNSKRFVNPVIKKKVQNAFQNFQNFTDLEKKQFILSIIEFQLMQKYSRNIQKSDNLVLFSEEQDPIEEKKFIKNIYQARQSVSDFISPNNKDNILNSSKCDLESQNNEDFVVNTVRTLKNKQKQIFNSKISIQSECDLDTQNNQDLVLNVARTRSQQNTEQ
ncbi:hypothetical protein ABPG74_012124 [Tetrahymena malaccensis]